MLYGDFKKLLMHYKNVLGQVTAKCKMKMFIFVKQIYTVHTRYAFRLVLLDSTAVITSLLLV